MSTDAIGISCIISLVLYFLAADMRAQLRLSREHSERRLLALQNIAREISVLAEAVKAMRTRRPTTEPSKWLDDLAARIEKK